MKSVKGFQFSGIHSGIKKENKDLALIYAPDGASFASVTTTNKFAAPGVHYTRAITKNETLLKAILVNSGNANALTGERGTQDILTLLRTLGEHINVKPTQGLALSTGIIGKFLPVGIMQEAMLKLTQSLTDNP
ncbi:MAG: bifunctional ornithine acetyltransferase/N-acetylglutamate synthase, partial [Candidatus Margulisiibacteriota bacterium]